jgi:hypothetical protein
VWPGYHPSLGFIVKMQVADVPAETVSLNTIPPSAGNALTVSGDERRDQDWEFVRESA